MPVLQLSNPVWSACLRIAIRISAETATVCSDVTTTLRCNNAILPYVPAVRGRVVVTARPLRLVYEEARTKLTPEGRDSVFLRDLIGATT